MVMVGWLRPPVTKLDPSTTNRLGTSWARWNLFTTDDLGSLPMRQVPRACAPPLESLTPSDQTWVAPAAFRMSAERSMKNCIALKSFSWLVVVMRMAGSPQASFTSGSRSTMLVPTGSWEMKDHGEPAIGLFDQRLLVAGA